MDHELGVTDVIQMWMLIWLRTSANHETTGGPAI